MNAAAKAVLTELPDITIAYGVSDEYRLVHSCEAHRGIHLLLTLSWQLCIPQELLLV
jgi:tRNA(His) 5'-end guanylyltransferase